MYIKPGFVQAADLVCSLACPNVKGDEQSWMCYLNGLLRSKVSPGETVRGLLTVSSSVCVYHFADILSTLQNNPVSLHMWKLSLRDVKSFPSRPHSEQWQQPQEDFPPSATSSSSLPWIKQSPAWGGAWNSGSNWVSSAKRPFRWTQINHWWLVCGQLSRGNIFYVVILVEFALCDTQLLGKLCAKELFVCVKQGRRTESILSASLKFVAQSELFCKVKDSFEIWIIIQDLLWGFGFSNNKQG